MTTIDMYEQSSGSHYPHPIGGRSLTPRPTKRKPLWGSPELFPMVIWDIDFSFPYGSSYNCVSNCVLMTRHVSNGRN